jgi:hypothetical protein
MKAAALLLVTSILFVPVVALADEAPPTLTDLQGLVAKRKSDEKPPELRNAAMKEAARSLGARGALAFQTEKVNELLRRMAPKLDAIFNFRQIMIHAAGGTMVKPPVVTEAEEAWIVSPDGNNVGTADVVLRIQQRERLVSAPPNWREYLLRGWGKPELPPDLLLPATSEEKEAWKKWVAEGWEIGLSQAEAIFLDDLARLQRDFIGMSRYTALVIQGAIEPPVVAQADRGVTGSDNVLKIGDRVVRITQHGRFNSKSENWKPALRVQP